METIFVGHGIEVEKEYGNYFLVYDAGEISDRMKKIAITEQEAIDVQKSSMDAYNIIIKYENELIKKMNE